MSDLMQDMTTHGEDMVGMNFQAGDDAIKILSQMKEQMIRNPSREMVDDYLLQISHLNEAYGEAEHTFKIKEFVTKQSYTDEMQRLKKEADDNGKKYVKNVAEVDAQIFIRSEKKGYKKAEAYSQRFETHLKGARDIWRSARDKLERNTSLDKDINSTSNNPSRG